jgi:hypothetical protein
MIKTKQLSKNEAKHITEIARIKVNILGSEYYADELPPAVLDYNKELIHIQDEINRWKKTLTIIDIARNSVVDKIIAELKAPHKL